MARHKHISMNAEKVHCGYCSPRQKHVQNTQKAAHKLCKHVALKKIFSAVFYVN